MKIYREALKELISSTVERHNELLETKKEIEGLNLVIEALKDVINQKVAIHEKIIDASNRAYLKQIGKTKEYNNQLLARDQEISILENEIRELKDSNNLLRGLK